MTAIPQGQCLAKLALLAYKQLDSQCRGAGPKAAPATANRNNHHGAAEYDQHDNDNGNGYGHGAGTRNPPAPPDVWRHLALLKAARSMLVAVQHLAAPSAAAAAATSNGGGAATAVPDELRTLSNLISRSANAALELAWDGSDGGAAGGGAAGAAGDGEGEEDEAAAAAARGGGGGGGGFKWRGQAKLISELLRLYVELSAEPLEVLK